MKRHGFTLIELIVVIAIIAILTGITLPIIGIIRRNADIKRTRATLDAVVLAMRQYGNDSITAQVAPGTLRTYPAWDWNLDQRLDGRPEIDVPGITASSHPDYALYAGGYRGFLDTVRPELPASAIGKDGQVIDAWRQVLRIGHAARIYGGESRGIWSSGPDLMDNTADDILSWGSK